MADVRDSKRQGSTGWLEPLIVALENPAPLLVLCRSSATARAVYRFLAEEAAAGGRKGFTGLRITTPTMLVAEAAPKSLLPVQEATLPLELPNGHPWKAKLADRPGLTSMLRQEMGRVHEAALVGAKAAGFGAEIRALLSADWGKPDQLEGARRLLEQPFAGRCLAVGFPPEPFSAMGQISPLVRALLRHLQPGVVDGGDPATAPDTSLSAVRVPDVAAEARACVREAAASAGVLVLVASSTTAERARAALARNGLGATDDQSDPLHSHALVALTAPLLPVFLSRGKEPLNAQDLLRLLTDPVLSRTVELPNLGRTYASVRHLREMIVGCRHAQATVDEWAELVAGLVKDAEAEVRDADEDHRAGRERRLASARVFQAQVELLRTHAKGRGKLGDLHACLDGIGLSAPADDRIGYAVLRMLRAAGHLPADCESYDSALSGTVGSGRVDRGVEILSYDAYDGRPSKRLLLLDVHDKGLAHLPASNPFLSADELALLGTPAPVDCARERLAVARWAASRAGSTLAVVTATDISGRAVSPPVELKLHFTDDHAIGAYGLDLDLPERQDRLALAEGKGKPGPIATQVDVEWLRRGAWLTSPDKAKPALEATAALPDHLERDLARLPDDLRPWLGQVGTCPESRDGLPSGFVASASRCEAFTRCLYRAFCESVLRLRVRDEIEEDLDAREVGSAVHASLAKALEGVSLLVPSKDLEKVQKEIGKRLRTTLPKEVKRLADAMPGAAREALGLAREGFVGRWSRFLDGYVKRLVRSVEDVQEGERSARMKGLKDSQQFVALVSVLGSGLAVGERASLGRNVLRVLCQSTGDVGTFLSGLARVTEDLNKKSTRLVELALPTPAVKKAAVALHAEARPLLEQVAYSHDGDLEVVCAELTFGAMGNGQPHEIRLGRKMLPVRGSIDLVVRHLGAEKGTSTRYRVIDFKTGKSVARVDEIADKVILPQLAIYALALEAMGPVERRHPAPAQVSHVQLDCVREKTVAVAVDEAQRKHWRDVLASVFTFARAGWFATLPHPDGCPLLRYKGAYCDFTEVCRARPGMRIGADGVDTDEEAAS